MSSVRVTNAGAFDGLYTPRGVSNSKRSYNLVGQADSTAQYDISNNGSLWVAHTDSETAFASDNNSADPWSATWTGGTFTAEASPWYNASWPYRVKVTVDNTKVDADLTAFPVYVNLANLPTGFHTNVNQTDARDIRVTNADGTTEVPREVVYYTAASDTGELHFKGTLSNTVNTDFYIYYGNAAAADYATTDTYGRNNVWDSNYKGVWHLPDGTTLTALDSTSNGKNGTVSGSVAAAGKVGGAALFDGTDDSISIAAIAPTSAATFSGWIYINGANANYGSIFANWGAAGNAYFIGTTAGTSSTIDVYFNGATPHSITGVSTGAWVFLAIRHTGSTVVSYINGTQTNSNAGTLVTATGNTSLGYDINRANYPFKGNLDEMRISDSDRGVNWIVTEYNNQNSPSTFYSLGSQEASGRFPPNIFARQAVNRASTY